MGVSENSVPLNPMVNDHYPMIKWLFHWEYTQHFQTNPYSCELIISILVDVFDSFPFFPQLLLILDFLKPQIFTSYNCWFALGSSHMWLGCKAPLSKKKTKTIEPAWTFDEATSHLSDLSPATLDNYCRLPNKDKDRADPELWKGIWYDRVGI